MWTCWCQSIFFLFLFLFCFLYLFCIFPLFSTNKIKCTAMQTPTWEKELSIRSVECLTHIFSYTLSIYATVGPGSLLSFWDSKSVFPLSKSPQQYPATVPDLGGSLFSQFLVMAFLHAKVSSLKRYKSFFWIIPSGIKHKYSIQGSLGIL